MIAVEYSRKHNVSFNRRCFQTCKLPIQIELNIAQLHTWKTALGKACIEVMHVAPAWGLRGLERSLRRSQTNPPGAVVSGIGASNDATCNQETTSTPTSWRTWAASGCWINFTNCLDFWIISSESSDDSLSWSKFKFVTIFYRNIWGTSKNIGLQFDPWNTKGPAMYAIQEAHWVRSCSRDLKCKTGSSAFWCLYLF